MEWIEQPGVIYIDRLNRGGYVEAHLLRPLTKYIKEINVIADYIKKVEREKSI